eukprot:TRINITY_DN11742_c0_g1_i1.p1 TRINITY_DN11742_c0_g1~~TRINITY_DN11742_c0_g1_i1.p1  ORF type:complete len:168 (-),score=40.89 TRINITY_DN11742_c0_g1_i1:23-526(-)
MSFLMESRRLDGGLEQIKNLCKQLLNGLVALHSTTPPTLLAYLNPDHVLIGSNGSVKILVDLRAPNTGGFIGNPEFVSKEVFDGNASEKSDVYSLGMCLLQMSTKSYPYEECKSVAAVVKRVFTGVLPEALAKIESNQLRKFIELCIAPVECRPYASELLQHPFLDN